MLYVSGLKCQLGKAGICHPGLHFHRSPRVQPLARHLQCVPYHVTQPPLPVNDTRFHSAHGLKHSSRAQRKTRTSLSTLHCFPALSRDVTRRLPLLRSLLMPRLTSDLQRCKHTARHLKHNYGKKHHYQGSLRNKEPSVTSAAASESCSVHIS